jgi:hypothetical protein
MKKLSLELAELAVESFETFVGERDRGTVRANCGCVTWSCGGTCGAAPASDVEKNGFGPVTEPRQCCV